MGWMPFGLHPGTVGLLFNGLMIITAHYVLPLRALATKIAD